MQKTICFERTLYGLGREGGFDWSKRRIYFNKYLINPTPIVFKETKNNVLKSH